jgi:hypothetical protein
MIFQHAQTVAATAHDCQPSTHTPDQARAILQAVLDCIDLVGGVTQAARPRASAPDKPALANRTRATPTQPAPMNPVSHHYGAGRSERPPGDTDSGYWRNEYQRVHTHHDRCEVVRRAGTYLHGLVRDAGLTSTTIATSLGCSSSAVRMWTTRQRRAA